MNPTGLRLADTNHYEVNMDYTIVRTTDGAVWMVEENIAGDIISAYQIIPPIN